MTKSPPELVEAHPLITELEFKSLALQGHNNFRLQVCYRVIDKLVGFMAQGFALLTGNFVIDDDAVALFPTTVNFFEDRVLLGKFFQAIFDMESPSVASGRVVLLGDAAFVARPHVGMGTTKAALDARYGLPIAYRWRCIECGPREIETTTKATRLLLGFDDHFARAKRAFEMASSLGVDTPISGDLLTLLVEENARGDVQSQAIGVVARNARALCMERLPDPQPLQRGAAGTAVRASRRRVVDRPVTGFREQQ